MIVGELSVVIIGPDEARRDHLVDALRQVHVTVSRELAIYPRLRLAGEDQPVLGCDVVLIDLDVDQDAALDLVAQVSTQDGAVTVIVYSASRDPDVVVRCMRAGAREFLTLPVSGDQLAEALARVSTRHSESVRSKPAELGKLLVFWGAKGGVGTTTLASNFAIALRAESDHRVALIDLNLQLGDVAMALGVEPQFTVEDALGSSDRLDNDFLSALLVDHRSGISILAGPDQFITHPLVENGNLAKLLQVLREKFTYVVVDAGSPPAADAAETLSVADRFYLVTEADIPTLRNTQRFVTHFRGQNGTGSRLALVLNRHRARSSIDEGQMVKALGLPIAWKVPNDYLKVQEALNTGEPLTPENSLVARSLQRMAREACGKPVEPVKPSRWSLRRRRQTSETVIVPDARPRV